MNPKPKIELPPAGPDVENPWLPVEPQAPEDERETNADRIKRLVRQASKIIVPPDEADSLYDSPIVDGLLRKGEVGILAGAAKAKKTFLTMDLARCVATGDDFLGAFPCRKGRVLMVDLELPENALKARLSRMLDEKSAQSVDVLSLRTAHELSAIACIETVWAAAIEKGEPYLLCTIDCLYALRDMPGDENDNAGVGDALRQIQAAATRTKTAVWVPHHMGKNGGQGRELVDRGRGASAIAGVCDVFASIMRNGEGEALQFEFVARNFADPDPRVRVVEFETHEHPWRFIDTGREPAKSKPGRKPKVEGSDVLAALSDGPASFEEIAARLENSGIKTSPTSIRRALDAVEEAGIVRRGTRPREEGQRGPKSVIVFALSDTSPN